MNAVALNAHFDGEKIALDDPFELEPGARLLVMVLPQEPSDSERDDWYELAKYGLARAYSEDEPEYSVDMIKELSPDYVGAISTGGITKDSNS